MNSTLKGLAHGTDNETRQPGLFDTNEEDLRMIDAAIEAVERGEIATDQEVEAVFAKHRD